MFFIGWQGDKSGRGGEVCVSKSPQGGILERGLFNYISNRWHVGAHMWHFDGDHPPGGMLKGSPPGGMLKGSPSCDKYIILFFMVIGQK